METRVLEAIDPARREDAVAAAAAALARGRLVVFPTETVYGVGADASSPEAVAALRALKQRPPEKPFTPHLAAPAEAATWAGPLPRVAQRLVRKVWPGPVMLVVPDAREAPADPPLVEDAVYYEGTVGLRCPLHDVGSAILARAGVPVVATSANLAGHDPPRSAREAAAELEGRVAVLVDAGPTAYRKPSTVVRVGTDGGWEVLREGAIPARRIARLAAVHILFVCTGNLCRSPMAAGIARQEVAARLGLHVEELASHGIEIASAGTAAMPGHPPSHNARVAMTEMGIDIRDDRSRAITVDALLAADYILVMTRGHAGALKALAPEVADRVHLLRPDGDDVADPIGGSLSRYRRCAREIADALEHWLPEML